MGRTSRGATTASTTFYSYDANGSVTSLTDTNGSNVATYVYGPFGGIVESSGTQADENPFRFSTKYTDDETGMLYYGYRYYDPELGRWVNRDPIGEEAHVLRRGLRSNGAVAFGFAVPSLRDLMHPYRFIDNTALGALDAVGERITVSMTVDAAALTVSVSIKATIQVIGCPAPKEGEEDAPKTSLESIWSPSGLSLTTSAGDTYAVTVNMEVTDIKYLSVGASDWNPDYHSFLIVESLGANSGAAQTGGNLAWIDKGDMTSGKLYAHEFGHWMNLPDLYTATTWGSVIYDPDPDNVCQPRRRTQK